MKGYPEPGRGKNVLCVPVYPLCLPVHPCVPHMRCVQVTTDNAGEAGAVVAANPSAHVGKVYNVVGPSYSNAILAELFSEALGKSVE